MRAKLITADSRFGLFAKLIESLDGNTRSLSQKNIIFCEEKLTLSVERAVCNAFNGSFNTTVCSFGKFLRKHKDINGLLTAEGSAMVVKKILESANLKCFNRSKKNLAPSLFELISQLKSAKITPEDILFAAENTEGILKNKLTDVGEVFSRYEERLKENGFTDQSAVLSYLPEIIEGDESLKTADVYIFGFSSFTGQIKSAIKSLVSVAKSVTAFLVEGENEFAFVNENAAVFIDICNSLGVKAETEKISGGYCPEGQILVNELFRPTLSSAKKTETDKIFSFSAQNVFAEAERVAELIRQTVDKGSLRYRDFTVVIPDPETYKDAVKKAFGLLDVPYFLDEKKKPENYPVISLVYAYVDLYIKGLSLSAFANFFKNRFVEENKDLTDRFYNYLYKYNISYERLKSPLTLTANSSEELSEFENFRKKILSLIGNFDVFGLLEKVNADEKTKRDCALLQSLGALEEAAVNAQILDSVKNVIKEIELISGKNLTPSEFKSLFSSGVSALELSIIPQYNDAVFVGGFRQASVFQAKRLFVMGLTADVPGAKEDVALLSDSDINALSEIKVLLEPKIRVVNHRLKEEAALGVAAFRETLYLSYPISGLSGKANGKSEIFGCAEALFTVKEVNLKNRYLTEKQGLKNFALDCGKFVGGETADFSDASGFYRATRSSAAENVVKHADKEIKFKLSGSEKLLRGVTSPTQIESYYRCPYRAFAERILHAKEREQGSPDVLNTGILAHEIFKNVFERYAEMESETKFFEIFDCESSKVLSEERFKKYEFSGESAFSVQNIREECKTYAFKTYRWLKSSGFSTGKGLLEVKFGENGATFPPVKLLNGRVNLSGVIDRIDVSGNDCRIIDYKTGATDDSVSALFTGEKLQLYLYSAAVTDKKTVGAYYVKIKDEYQSDKTEKATLASGKTVGDENSACLSDENLKTCDKSEFIPVEKTEKGIKNLTSFEDFELLKKYALILSDNAAKQMLEGIIVPSPLKDACKYCNFSAVCGKIHDGERKPSSVGEAYVIESVKAYEEGNSDE